MIFTKNHSRRTGFSMIELLVVISLIGVLTAIVLAQFSEARAEARDKIRLADMTELNQAFELFYLDNNHYPGTDEGIPTTGQVIGIGLEIDTALAPYLSEIPQDPRHNVPNGVSPTQDDNGLFFYSYDPRHMAINNPCPFTQSDADDYIANVGPIPQAPVFGFNSAESGGTFRKDTCGGGNLNLDEAAYNRALIE